MMKLSKMLFGAVYATTFAVQPAGAAGPSDKPVIEVVTLKIKAGVSAEAFTRIDKRVEDEQVSKQPGFISREHALGSNNEWLAIVHWRSIKDAEASMASFEKAPAAADFMASIVPSSMVMTRYQK